MTSPSTNTNNSSASRLLFASCNSQHHEQVLWPAMMARNASAFVWGGDAIYGDDRVKEATPPLLNRLYREQMQHPGYAALVNSGIPIWGVLDDHDYGVNNGDATFPHRRESAALFACEFLRLGAACDRAKRGLGVYGVKVMDFDRPPGHQVLTDEEAGIDPDVMDATSSTSPSSKTVAIFLLDVRSNKTPYTKKMGSEPGDFLGEAQWTWFERALPRSTAAVNIIVQGLQVHADRQGPVETWSRFPDAQRRMYQALLQSNVQVPILISGDVHHAQFLRKDCSRAGKGDHPANRMLLEITTSGMTHSWGSGQVCARPHQLFLCRWMWSQWVASKAMLLAQHINGWFVWTEVIHLSHSGQGKQGLQFTLDLNFAELELDFENKKLTAQILGQYVGASPLLVHQWSFQELSPDNSADQGDGSPWTCRNYRGNSNSFLREVGFVIPVMIGIVVFLSPVLLLVFSIVRLCRHGRPRKLKHS